MFFVLWFPESEQKKIGMFNMIFQSRCLTSSLRPQLNVLETKKVEKKYFLCFSYIEQNFLSHLVEWFLQCCQLNMSIIVKYAVFLSNRTFRGMSFHRNKFFHHFLQLNQKFLDFVSFFQQFFRKFFFPLKRTFEGEVLAYKWKFRREISGHWAENFCNSHIFSQTISQKMIFPFAIIFRQCLQSCFRRRRGEKKTFFPGLSVFFKKSSGHWAETLMQSGKLFRQFHQNCFLRALFKIFVKKSFLVMFHQSSFLDICWKKVVISA